MPNLLKAVFAGAVFFYAATPAIADKTVEAEFAFDRSAPVEETLAAFWATAKTACHVDVHAVPSISEAMRMRDACAERMVGDAVRATGLPALIALHDGTLSPDDAHRQFAGQTE